ncbi:uncharacterized protein LOC141525696 [Cotesia typhae]|uniref:uncharacterized protein LOC141525696 n=1 Tax=Cotesia typhae TaxID=2053667 RepID=UPI003D685FA4
MLLRTSVGAKITCPGEGYGKKPKRTSIKIKSPVLLLRDEQDRVLALVVDTVVSLHESPGQEGGPDQGPPAGQADIVNQQLQSRLSGAASLYPVGSADQETHTLYSDIRQKLVKTYYKPTTTQHTDKVSKLSNTPSTRIPVNARSNPLARSDITNRELVFTRNRSVCQVNCATSVQSFSVCSQVIIPPEDIVQPSANNISNNNNNDINNTNINSSNNSKSHRKFIEILEGSNQSVRNINKKLLTIAQVMAPSWSMRLLGVSCGSVVCAWGLLLVLSVLGGASHSTGLNGYDFDNAGTMEDLNGGRCPWACSCEGQDLDCSERGLTQVPGDLAVLAEKFGIPRKFDWEKRHRSCTVEMDYKEDGELFCRYPPSEEYNKLDKYAQELIDACENWEKYAVTILTYADSYSKGKRRLKRAYKTIEIRSTDDDHNQEITMPTVFSKQSINDEFRSVPAMENHPSTSSGKKYSKHKQKEKLDDDEVEAADELAPIIEAHEVFDFDSMKEYIKKKIDDQTTTLHRYLTNEKKSLQYDIKKYFEEIKNTLVANISSRPPESLSTATSSLDVSLPLKTLEEFQEFDEELKNIESKKKALIVLFRFNVYGETTVKGCINKMASAILTKNIEKFYSGTGKIVKGVGKLNFSNTETFKCMKEVVSEKFGNSEECKNFAGKVGRWLSGCGDRENGRKQRSLSV